MEKEIESFEFRALTIRSFIIAMLVFSVFIIITTIGMDKLFFYDEKGTSPITSLKTVGIPLIFSGILELIISQYLISSIYTIQLGENSITILKKNMTIRQIPLNEIDLIELGISNKPVIGSIKIKYIGNNFILFNGFLATFYKEKKILEKIIIDEINPYFGNKGLFKLEKKTNSNSIAYIYTKK